MKRIIEYYFNKRNSVNFNYFKKVDYQKGTLTDNKIESTNVCGFYISK